MQTLMCLDRKAQREGAAMEEAISLPGVELGPGCWGEEVGFRGGDDAGGSGVMEQFHKMGGGRCLWRALYVRRRSEQQGSGCAEVYLGLWMMCHKGCCRRSQF